MEWLEQNLERVYPFVDGTPDPLTGIVADARIVTGIEGPLTLTTFTPQSLTNALVVIMSGVTTVLSTTAAVVTTTGAFTTLTAHDTVNDSWCTLICSTVGLQTYTNLTTTLTFVPTAITLIPPYVQSINGLTGAVTLSLPNYSIVTETGDTVTVAFQDGNGRFNCDAPPAGWPTSGVGAIVPCDQQVFTINGIGPDQFGSFSLTPDTCLRLGPTAINYQLVAADFCLPCVDSARVVRTDQWLAEASKYFYDLAAIVTDQFNRYQYAVAQANIEIASAASRAVVSAPGFFDLGVRSFNRPYFSQIVIAVANTTAATCTVSLIIDAGSLDSAFSPVPNSAIIQQFLTTGQQFTPIVTTVPSPSVPVVLNMGPNETATITAEVQMNPVVPPNVLPTSGTWTVTATTVFTEGGNPTIVLTRTAPLVVMGGS
jgi:hypothetical protein